MHFAIKNNFLIAFMILLGGCAGAKFHVKVVDQHDNPVPDVNVQVGVLTHLFLAVGSRTDFYTTDEDGRFELGGPRVGVEFIEKNGYEFSGKYGYGSKSINMSFNRKTHKNSYKNPYYILAWKRDIPEPLIGSHNARGTTLLSSEYYIKAFFSEKPIYYEKMTEFKALNQIDGVLLIKYTENKNEVLKYIAKKMHPWELTLAVPQGGLIETDDIVRNLAPENGYQQTWIIRSTDLKRVGYSTQKTFYLKSKNGQVYGQFSIEFRPYRHSFVIKPYWLNLNGSRNLTRPKKYVYCNGHNSPPDCSLDDYGP